MTRLTLRNLTLLAAAVWLGLAGASVRAETPVVPELTLRHQVAVDGATIRLADLFDGLAPGEFADTVVGYAPQPGRRAVFDAEWLSRLAYKLRLAWQPTSRLDRAIVTRNSTVISAADITDALTEELAQRGAEGAFEISLSNRNMMLHIDSRYPASIEVASLSTDARSERFTAIVAVPAGDPQARRFQVSGQVFATIEVPVPVRSLRPGETLRERDIEWQRIRAAEVRTNMLTELDAMVGQEVRRPLRAGVPIRISDLRVPVAVAKGATVTMIYRTPTMLLTATGRARQSGSRGDVIHVVNTQTEMSIDARILGPDRVEVIAGEQLALGYGDSK